MVSIRSCKNLLRSSLAFVCSSSRMESSMPLNFFSKLMGSLPLLIPAQRTLHRLRVVAPMADHLVTATPRTAHALRPAKLAHQCEALGVVQQPGSASV